MTDTNTTIDALTALAAETITLTERLKSPEAWEEFAQKIDGSAYCAIGPEHTGPMARVSAGRDAAFIVHARTAAPTMARALTALLPALKEWREAHRVCDTLAHSEDPSDGSLNDRFEDALDIRARARDALIATFDTLASLASPSAPGEAP